MAGELDLSRLFVEPNARPTKMNLNVGKSLGVVHDRNVQVSAHYGMDYFLFILSVRLEINRSINFVDHAPFDCDREVKHRLQ